MNFLKNLFGSGRAAANQEEAVPYKGFTIQPRPKKVAHGWTTEAVIAFEKDGQMQTQEFIRADISFSREDAVDLTLKKAQTMIDFMDEKSFPK
ncbi:MAG: HlyU family transcriptional regulator [Gammaproteobacteria bacterium]|nr:HlyU family transcriptional regulator [Gammaproteobacteria bacterium]